jgi:hypothetical protein
VAFVVGEVFAKILWNALVQEDLHAIRSNDSFALSSAAIAISRVTPGNCSQKFIKCVAVLDVIEQVPKRNARAAEAGLTAHNFWVPSNHIFHTVIFT